MNNEDFVTYDIAVRFKKAGFDWPCYFYYTKENATDDEVWFTTAGVHAKDWNSGRNDEPDFLKPLCSAPSLWEAQKWLRDEWDIHIDACVFGDCSEDADGKVADEWTFWAFDIYNTESGRQIVDYDEEYDNYEAALSAGIEAALKLIEEGDIDT